MSDFTFKKAEKDDAIQLAELVYELNLYHGDDIKVDPNKLVEDWKHIDAYVIAKDDELVAFLSGYDNYKFHTATVRFEIQNLHVKAEYRRNGLAKMLFENVISEKYKQGIKRFSLGVEKDNPAAIAFYEDFGFEERGGNQVRYSLQGENLEKIINKGTI